MHRKLPLCAYCGKTLVRAMPRIVVELNDLPGKPVVGWHGECHRIDVFRYGRPCLMVQDPKDVEAIRARGRGRVLYLTRTGTS